MKSYYALFKAGVGFMSILGGWMPNDGNFTATSLVVAFDKSVAHKKAGIS